MTIALPQVSPAAAISRYVGYAYAYPHKTAYRHLDPAVPLADAWADEDKRSLFLYTHLPFCEMRCGFCNLFTLAQPQDDVVSAYLSTLETEAVHTADALGAATFTQMAVGGGTPTFLDELQLDRLFDIVERTFRVRLGTIPLSVETSPRTATAAKMRLLKERGASRVSIGVQSFVEREVAAAGRAQKNVDAHAAIERIQKAGIATLNLDLIYGLPGQTLDSWLHSLRTALVHRPEELYLYPLYVRPLTGIARRETEIDDIRVALYEAARELLAGSGYRQVSMRMFRRPDAVGELEPVYCCQDDGMVGIGCGARSYTTGLHYSREFAVGRESVKSILQNYIGRPPGDFDSIDYGCRLNAHEQRRRYIIKSVLRFEGFSLAAYRERFGGDPFMDVPELRSLLAENFLVLDGGFVRPTSTGVDHSDLIGPRLFSADMQHSMQEFELR